PRAPTGAGGGRPAPLNRERAVATVAAQHDLEGILGAERVRQGTAIDAVDGVQPRFTVEPATVEEAASVLRLCAANGLTVVPRGGGSKIHWGAPPERFDVVLSTVRLDGVLEHTAGDLVVRVQPGVPL